MTFHEVMTTLAGATLALEVAVPAVVVVREAWPRVVPVLPRQPWRLGRTERREVTR